MKATLKMIAQETSVSLATVSKVLNGRDGVAPDTRAKIEILLREHGYKRQVMAGRRGGLIEIVFDKVDSSWSLELIRGVERAARENELSVVVSESGDRTAPAADWIEGVLRRRPVGAILVFSNLHREDLRRLRERNIQVAVVDPAGDPGVDVTSIGSANWAGGFEATRHLTELGHRRIGMITGPEGLLCSRARVSGYRSAIEATGLEVDEALIVVGDFTQEAGHEGAGALLDRPQRPTAIFAGNDMQAFGVYAAAAERGISIPDDLSVIGYDDIAAATWVTPRLSTIHQPLAEMTEEAVRVILKLRSDKEASPVRIDMAADLVARASTAPPKSIETRAE